MSKKKGFNRFYYFVEVQRYAFLFLALLSFSSNVFFCLEKRLIDYYEITGSIIAFIIITISFILKNRKKILSVRLFSIYLLVYCLSYIFLTAYYYTLPILGALMAISMLSKTLEDDRLTKRIYILAISIYVLGIILQKSSLISINNGEITDSILNVFVTVYMTISTFICIFYCQRQDLNIRINVRN